MKILQHEKLVVGDIILTTTGSPVSLAIRKATKADISHAMLYVAACSVIDATSEGVQARNTQRLLIEDNRAVHVMRLRGGLRPKESRTICDYVRGRVGTQYGTREALKTATGGDDTWSEKQFCSRLVAQAYASVGIKLVANENYCSPNDILQSPLLEEISDVTRQAVDSDFWFEKVADLPQQMRDATNAFFKRVRLKNSAIQNFNDVYQHLISNPGDDEYFAKALEDSGYLTVWQVEVDESPWHYDLAVMEAIPSTNDVKDYCITILEDSGQARRRCAINAHAHQQLYKEYPLKTFEALRDLDALLLDLLHARRFVAATWLSRHAPDALPPIMPTPHTKEWFEQLDIEEPQKAKMTRAILSAAGRDNVCSICGDDPAIDYRRAGPILPGILSLTLRLCDDCLAVRDELFGEKYVPLEPSNPGSRGT